MALSDSAMWPAAIGAGARRKAERRGRLAEWLAALWLMLCGYEILARRARTPFGELDLVARRGRTLAIVEVKARPDVIAGLESVGLRAQGRIARAALAWRARRRQLAGLDLRFDLVIIAPRAWPNHRRAAWRPEPSAWG